MKSTRKHITPAQLREWAASAQLRFLDAVMQCGAWKPHELAFHGGTSLHMSWASPRFSEDLDFLLDASYAERLPKIIKLVERRLQEQFLTEDAAFSVEIRNKTKDDARLGNFHIVVSHANVIGNTMVKAEFWMVDADYLKNYPTTFRTPMIPGHVVAKVSAPIPAAELTSAYADKLTAFATRPFLKWRDLYDLWWLGTQVRAVPDPANPEIIRQFLHNLSGYKTPDGMSAGQALSRFHEHNVDDLVKLADSELRRWLPPTQWDILSRMDGVREIVRYVDASLRKVEAALEGSEPAQSAGTATTATEVPRVSAVTANAARRPKP